MESRNCQENTLVSYNGEVTDPHHGGKIYDVFLDDDEENELDEAFNNIFGDEAD